MNVTLLLAALAAAQPDGDQVRFAPEGPPPRASRPNQNNIEARREARDRVLARVPGSLNLMMEFGDLGIAAMQSCPDEVGKRLVGLYESGELSRAKSPRAVMEAIRVHGAPVGQWVAEHCGELADPEQCDCFCRAPMEFVYQMQSLPAKAAEARASRRLAPGWVANGLPPDWNAGHYVLACLIAALIGVVIWRRRSAPAP